MEQTPAMKKKHFVGLYIMPLDPTKGRTTKGKEGGAYDRVSFGVSGRDHQQARKQTSTKFENT
jgi:hypothetical protein